MNVFKLFVSFVWFEYILSVWISKELNTILYNYFVCHVRKHLWFLVTIQPSVHQRSMYRYSICFYFYFQSPNNVFRYEVIGDGDGPSYFFVNQNDGSVTLIKSVLNTGASGYTVRHHNKKLFPNLIIILSIVILKFVYVFAPVNESVMNYRVHGFHIKSSIKQNFFYSELCNGHRTILI